MDIVILGCLFYSVRGPVVYNARTMLLEKCKTLLNIQSTSILLEVQVRVRVIFKSTLLFLLRKYWMLIVLFIIKHCLKGGY